MSSKSKTERIPHNERLEFLGDAVIDLVMADLLYRKYPNRDEGFLTEMRAKAVSTKNHSALSQKMGLASLLQFDSQHQRTMLTASMQADVYEALIAAIYLDRGYNAVHQFISKQIIGAYIDFNELEKLDENYKSRLFEWAQRNNKAVSFELVKIQHAGQKKHFTIALCLDGISVSEGMEFSKKEAEQNACMRFLKAEGIIPSL
jgi:ribonuclease-3